MTPNTPILAPDGRARLIDLKLCKPREATP
jgi:hypothetical protein